MAACPVCHSAIEITAQHYGTLYTCSKCSAVFFVDWNGQPEVAEPEASVEADAAPAAFQAVNHFESNSFPEPHLSNDSVHEESSPAYSEASSEAPYTESPEAPYTESLEAPYTESTESPEAELESSRDSAVESYDSSGVPDLFAEADLLLSPEPASDSTAFEGSQNPFAEISEFGNAETSQAAFSYTVFISGIDSAAIRASLLEALSDKKFGWEAGPLLSQMKDGVLTIRSVTAVKASILIQRLKFLPVQVSWRQDVLSGSV